MSCPECGRDHCAECTRRYALLSWLVTIERYWEDVAGVSHIVTAGRALCTGSPSPNPEEIACP